MKQERGQREDNVLSTNQTDGLYTPPKSANPGLRLRGGYTLVLWAQDGVNFCLSPPLSKQQRGVLSKVTMLLLL